MSFCLSNHGIKNMSLCPEGEGVGGMGGPVSFCRHLEDGEVDASVGSVLDETGRLAEVVLLAMLEDEDAVGLQQAALQHEVGNPGQRFQRVGRVGEDEVELLVAALDEPEALADETGMVAVGLYADHLAASSRQKFQADAARAGEEVERMGALEVEIARHDVEDVLFGKVGGGPGFERSWDVEMASLVFPGDDSHVCWLMVACGAAVLLSSFQEEYADVHGQALDFGDGSTVELGFGVDDIDALQAFLQVGEQRLPFVDTAEDVEFVVAGVHAQQLPHVKDEIGGVEWRHDFIMVAELEAVLPEAEDLHFVVVEIGVELVSAAAEAAMVHVAPHGLHERQYPDVVEMVVDDHVQVLVEWKQRDGVLVGEDGMDDEVVAHAGEGM